MTPESLDSIQNLEARLGLPKEFFLKLSWENDWTFTIKLNALFEAVSTELLCKRLKAPELEDAFAHLDFGNPKSGKVVLLRKLGCLTKEDKNFLKMLYELRNRIAHNISDVEFSLVSHIEAMDANQKSSFYKAVIAGGESEIWWNGDMKPKTQLIPVHPKVAISYTAGDVLASMCRQIDEL